MKQLENKLTCQYWKYIQKNLRIKAQKGVKVTVRHALNLKRKKHLIQYWLVFKTNSQLN